MSRTRQSLVTLSLVLCGVAWKISAIQSEEPATTPPIAETGKSDPNAKPQLVTVDEARRQAKLLHTAMHTTLQLVHHRYYREDEGLPIPAAVVDEAFTDIATEHPIKLQWLVVEGQAMNTDHKARSDFEHAAVSALKSGAASHEEVDSGTYRHAGPITLTNHCLKCHVPDRKSTANRTAGLIISIPVKQEPE